MFRDLFLAIVVCGLFFAHATSQAETPPWQPGLTDRELAMQRWLSSLTFLADREATPWPEWHDDGDQLGVTALRYQIAFAGYGCAAMAGKTPAYHELVQEQLGDLCQRQIDVRTWYYVTKYWKYADDLPDPCEYENVMYTGHLTQLMCLYELLTSDMRYSDHGWDFVWRDGRRTHYTLGKAVAHLHDLSRASPSGGISCEPGLVFAMCNNHSAVSMHLFDLVHGTRYAEANGRWFEWMSANYRNPSPDASAFLYAVYAQRMAMFLPVSDVGADGWTLGWGNVWFPDADFAREGWNYDLEHAPWQRPAEGQMYAEGSAVGGCCGGKKSLVGNAFLPLLAVQVEGADGPTARKILDWLEANHGHGVDTDGDGQDDGYYYSIEEATRISETGNIAAALATDGPSLRKLYQTPRTAILASPTLSHVDYPNVYVRAAEYIAPTLRFAVLPGNPGFRGKTRLVCSRIPANVALLRDGKPFRDYRQEGSTLTIATELDREQVFEITAVEQR